MARAVVGGVELFWEEVGRGRPVVFIHHLGGSADVWIPLNLRLATVVRSIRYDVRGHGRSAVVAAPASLDDLAADLIGLLGELGVARASLVGICMGGMIAMTTALRRPDLVDTLTLIDTACEYDDDARAQLRARANTAEREGTAALAAGLAERWFTPAFRALNPALVDGQLRILAATDPTGYAVAARAVAAVDLAADLPRLRCPTLVLVGAQDRSTPPGAARRLHDLIPASELHVIASAAHLSVVEQPEIVAQLLNSFLARTART